MKKAIALFTLAILGFSVTGGSAAENIAALATNIARGAQSDEFLHRFRRRRNARFPCSRFAQDGEFCHFNWK